MLVVNVLVNWSHWELSCCHVEVTIKAIIDIKKPHRAPEIVIRVHTWLYTDLSICSFEWRLKSFDIYAIWNIIFFFYYYNTIMSWFTLAYFYICNKSYFIVNLIFLRLKAFEKRVGEGMVSKLILTCYLHITKIKCFDKNRYVGNKYAHIEITLWYAWK